MYHKATQAKKKDCTSQQGFTLVEMLVSIGIFVIVTTIAVYNQGRFNSSVLLTNLAYEIALSMRQAQFYGITVKGITSTITSKTTFEGGYGVHFDANTTQYTLFEDRDPSPENGLLESNGLFDSGEALEAFSIKKGNKVGKICLTSGLSTSCSFTSVDISFVRPNPDSRILSGGVSFGKAEICVSSSQNTYRKILVDLSGQISVTLDSTSLCD